jgi:hypothetical protein
VLAWRVMSSTFAHHAILSSGPMWEVAALFGRRRARTRPCGRDLAPTFTPGAVLSSGVARVVWPRVMIAESTVIAVPGGSPRWAVATHLGPERAHVGVTSRPRSRLARSYRAA